jgi:hypothetical protein
VTTTSIVKPSMITLIGALRDHQATQARSSYVHRHVSRSIRMYSRPALNYLLDLLRISGVFAFTPLLGSLGSSFGIHNIIPPSETACVVTNETFMVNIMMLSTGPKRNEVVQTPREVVATVGIDCLEKTGGNPEIHSEDMEILREQGPEDRDHYSPSTKDHRLNWRSIFGRETERCRVLVVNLMDVLVQRTPVHRSVHPVMPSVLQHEEDSNLSSYCRPVWKRDPSIHSACFGHGVEEPDLRQFDRNMAEEDEFGARPLLCHRGDFLVLNLVFVEIWDAIDDNPGKTPAKVYHLMHNKAHNAGGNDIVLHVGIPTLHLKVSGLVGKGGRQSTYSPQALEKV